MLLSGDCYCDLESWAYPVTQLLQSLLSYEKQPLHRNTGESLSGCLLGGVGGLSVITTDQDGIEVTLSQCCKERGGPVVYWHASTMGKVNQGYTNQHAVISVQC